MQCVLSLIFRFKTTVDYVMKNISIIITIYKYLMIYFNHNRTHRKNAEKDLVHIVKVSGDTFAQSEIIPKFGIMLCVLSLISSYQNYCALCDKKHIKNNYHVFIIFI